MVLHTAKLMPLISQSMISVTSNITATPHLTLLSFLVSVKLSQWCFRFYNLIRYVFLCNVYSLTLSPFSQESLSLNSSSDRKLFVGPVQGGYDAWHTTTEFNRAHGDTPVFRCLILTPDPNPDPNPYIGSWISMKLRRHSRDTK